MSSRWVLLPALGAPLAHAPVLRFDLAPGLSRPISRRLFGQNKTWRGALVINVGTLAAAVFLYRLPAYRRRLSEQVLNAGPVTVGSLLGLALWAGELPNSFFKRRLGIPPGERLRGPLGIPISIFDQADWVPAAWLLLRPICPISTRQAAYLFATVAVLHVPINLIGFALGVRKHPL